MELAKNSQMIKDVKDTEKLQEYLNTLNDDVQGLFRLSQGRIRFGNGTDGEKGSNISGEFQVVADTGTANVEFSVTHTLGAMQIGFLVTNIDKAGVVYSSGTTNTSTTSYFKCSVANCAVTLFLIK